MKYLNLVRYKNLIFIILLQWMMYYCVCTPALMSFHVEGMSWTIFLLLCSSTVLIAAGGYAINDYFDMKIDLLNHPEDLLVGRSITKMQASWIHHITTAVGTILGLVAAYFTKSYTLVFLYLMMPGLLWFYSASYKRQFLIGNIVVSFCAACVPLLIVIAEGAILSEKYGELLLETPINRVLYASVLSFSVFAFLLTLIREMIKDMEDQYGDKEVECRTVPIVLGNEKTKIILYVLLATVILGLFFVNYKYISNFGLFGEPSTVSIRYFIFGVILPIVCLVYLLIKAKKTVDFHQASVCCKFIMLTGSVYALVYYFLIAKANYLVLFGLFQIVN